MNQPAQPDAPRSATTAPPAQIGPYRILEQLGEGGMGTVYLAEQIEPIKRRVALKVIKLGMDTRAVVARFEQERQALALMQHDGIAKVHDCGTTERGQPFFVMELVKGIPLLQFCEQQRLSVVQRVQLVQQVCAAVQHAHQKGVVHRDLKPGNVLVSDEGGKVQVKIIDFGLAKAMGQKLVEATLFTEAGQIVGTPEYMAPEQADPTNQDIDTRADIYSIGVMLYELLVGDLPFPGRELRRAGILEMQRVLREVDPPKPSTKLMKGAGLEVAAARRMSLGALRKALQTDLDWVVLKALEKERNRRYETANALAADLQRFLDHEPLAAGPPSAGYRLRKLVRRYRGQAVAGAVVFVALLCGIAATTWQAGIAVRERRRAEINLQRFNAVRYKALLDEAKALADELHPAWPQNTPRYEYWLAKFDESLRLASEQIPGAIALLGGLARTRIGDELLRELDQLTASLLDQTPRSLDPDPTLGFLRDMLRRAATETGALRDPRTGLVADVRRRLAWSRQVDSLTAAHPRARVTWEQARVAIRASDGVSASTLYRRNPPIDLRPQMGLVPLGMNAVTKLWEFYELRTAWDGETDPRTIPIPVQTPDGGIDLRDDTGLVFVLVPGGNAVLGTQDRDPDGPNYDAYVDEPLRRTAIDCFFLSKYEMTVGQWFRVAASRPNFWDPETMRGVVSRERFTDRDPVESITWDEASQQMERLGLALPTEEQWEYACRAGNPAPYSCGRDPACLRTHANVLDRAAGRTWGGIAEDWDDGFLICAPVGSFKPNAFGLFDMHGNVAEWCAGWFREGTGKERQGHPYRGGSYFGSAFLARSSFRRTPPKDRDWDLGVRPARPVLP